MSPDDVISKLKRAATEYDSKQARKKFYNPYALGQYFERIDEIGNDIRGGASIRSAIVAGFSGPLLNAMLRSVGEPKATDDDNRGHFIYTPVSNRSESE